MKTINQVFQFRAKQLREGAGLDFKALARATGIPERTLRSMEEGAIPLKKPENLRKLAKYYGVAVTLFFADPELMPKKVDVPDPSMDQMLSELIRLLPALNKEELGSALLTVKAFVERSSADIADASLNERDGSD